MKEQNRPEIVSKDYFDEIDHQASLIKESGKGKENRKAPMKAKDVSKQTNVLIDTFNLLKDDAVRRSDYVAASKFRNRIDELKLQLKYPPAPENSQRQQIREIMKLTECDAPGIYDPHVIELVNRMARMALELPTCSAENWSHNKPKEPGAPQGTEEQASDIPPNEPGGPPKGASDTLDLGLTLHQALDMLSGDLSYDNVAAVKQILKNIIHCERDR